MKMENPSYRSLEMFKKIHSDYFGCGFEKDNVMLC